MIVFDLHKKTATYSDYLKTPEGAKYQLIGGEIIEMPSPTLYHQRIVTRLSRKIGNFILDNSLGEVFVAPLDVYFSDIETYQPDIFVLLNESLSKMKAKNVEGAPDLIVEVLSPSTAFYDLNHKKSIYEKFGVKEYWIVDQDLKTIELLENENGKYFKVSEFIATDILQSKLFQDLKIQLLEVF